MEGRLVNKALSSTRRGRSRPRRRSRIPRWRIVLFVVLFALGLGASYFAVRAVVEHPALRVTEIAIRGTDRIDDAEIAAIAEIARGTPVLVSPIHDIRARVETIAGVRAAVVSRRPPRVVEVAVDEREPIARIVERRRARFVDADGVLFPVREARPDDAALPVLQGVRTSVEATRLHESDRPAIEALVAFVEVTGEKPPPGTTVDVSLGDRILLRPGRDAPALWLDRDAPETNLETLFAWRDEIARLAPGRDVDLRFPHRLTVLPPERSETRR